MGVAAEVDVVDITIIELCAFEYLFDTPLTLYFQINLKKNISWCFCFFVFFFEIFGVL